MKSSWFVLTFAARDLTPVASIMNYTDSDFSLEQEETHGKYKLKLASHKLAMDLSLFQHTNTCLHKLILSK